MELILTHENADFDAVASQMAAHKLFPEAIPVLPTRLNRNVREFLGLFGDTLPFTAAAELSRRPVGRVILVDTQHAQTVRGMGKKTRFTIIDHHEQAARPDREMMVEAVGATSTILCEKLQADGISLTPIEATLLTLGIYEDTGSLTYGTTTSRDMIAAAWLLGQGAMLDVVRGFMRHVLDDEQRKVYEKLSRHIERHEIGGATIVIAATRKRKPVAEISVVAHELREALDPSALFILVDFGSYVQLIARSNTDEVDVGAVAERMGGGGHSRAAAGILRNKGLAKAREELLALLHEGVKAGPTVAELMSNGVQTLGPSARAREAHARMRRYGYEGFPVVKDGRVIGLVTRRAVDRALDHGLDDLKVEQIMETGEVSIRRESSLAALHRMMAESGWGQIPVVGEDGKIVGVVTRTDLIRHLGGRREGRDIHYGGPDRRAEIGALLAAALPAALMATAREAGQAAEAMGSRLFVVGGVVRDLLLGLPLSDVDFVVEGDAVALTRTLRDRFGGQMRSHERFGTGKWLLDKATWSRIGEALGAPVDGNRLPEHIDFVTARTEFYNAPSELPEVEQATIKHDLHRRDFTINTLAIQLDPAAFGALLDFYGGEQDLAERRIRVLHSLSLVDDPTRILRAARLEQRLNFRIDRRTEELIGQAVALLERVSGDRIRHELDLIFEEKQPEAALARLDGLGVLRALHPALGWAEAMATPYAEMRAARDEPAWPELAALDLTLPYFGVLTFAMDEGAVGQLCQRLKVRRRTVQTLESLRGLRSRIGRLGEGLKPSEVDQILNGVNDWALLAAWALESSATARQSIVDYARRLRHISPMATGETLLARGHRPGPEFKAVLGRLRSAWLDGEVGDAEGESALLERLLAEMELPHIVQ